MQDDVNGIAPEGLGGETPLGRCPQAGPHPWERDQRSGPKDKGRTRDPATLLFSLPCAVGAKGLRDPSAATEQHDPGAWDSSGVSEALINVYVRRWLQSHHHQLSTFKQQRPSHPEGAPGSSGSTEPAAVHPDSTQLVRTWPPTRVDREEVRAHGRLTRNIPIPSEGSRRGKG